ncbi:MAG TPA: hypothetical protein VIF14_16920 [Alphaproteobacteria bacterium]|jgi:hypothetical protein
MKTLIAAALLAAALAAPPARAESGNVLRCVVHATPEAGRLATCTAIVGPGKRETTFLLIGREPNVITRVEMFEIGSDKPYQVIDGLELRPRLVRGNALSDGQIDVVLQDVNFDRYADLRIAIGPADGDGIAYRWFLFDRAADAFVPTDRLDRLRSPVINARRRLLQSTFKDERGRTGRIAFKWRDGQLEPVAAIAQERTEDGRCIASHYLQRDGKLEKTRETECRAGGEPDGE